MRKILALTLCVIILIGLIPISAYAQNAVPFYNNVLNHSETFVIDENGDVQISVSYSGQKNILESADIKVTLKKCVLWIFWNDVEVWTDSSTNYYYYNTFSTNVGGGTYRALIEYTFNGNNGSPDIITQEIEKSC